MRSAISTYTIAATFHIFVISATDVLNLGQLQLQNIKYVYIQVYPGTGTVVYSTITDVKHLLRKWITHLVVIHANPSCSLSRGTYTEIQVWLWNSKASAIRCGPSGVS